MRADVPHPWARVFSNTNAVSLTPGPRLSDNAAQRGKAMMKRKITIEQLNAEDDDGFLVALQGLYAHNEWVIRRISVARPFVSAPALLHALWRCVSTATEDEQLTVIRAHADLADGADGAATLDDDWTVPATAARSTVHDGNPDVPGDASAAAKARREALAAEKRAYHKRFGFPFVLAVEGHDSRAASGWSDGAGQGSRDAEWTAGISFDSVLATLRRRMRAQRRDELAEAVRQVNRIAELRLNHLLGRQAFHGREVMRWCELLAEHSEDRPGDGADGTPVLTCTYLTPTHRACAVLIMGWMLQAGMQAHVDVFGNVIGRYRSSVAGARTLITGSHYDTVRNGGKYDGRVGILLPISLIAEMHRRGEQFPFHIDVIAFAEEEGVRFKTSFLGSSALTGNIDDTVLARADETGQTLRDVIVTHAAQLAEAGRPNGRVIDDPATLLHLALREAKRDPATLVAFLEVHIEQGPVLFTEQLPVGVVTAISGSKRYLVHLTGVAGHAGAMPMDLRRDAAAAAAEITLYVEQRCSGVPTLVGTVGRLEVPNGSVNVVPGRCLLSVDIRAGDDVVRDAAVSDVMTRIQAICNRRGVLVETELILASDTVPCAAGLQSRFGRALDRLGVPVRYLPSGAGHDAVEMSRIADVGMLFVRCGNGGISHNPLETVSAEDLDLAGEAFRDTVDGLAAEEWRSVAELDRIRT